MTFKKDGKLVWWANQNITATRKSGSLSCDVALG